MCGIYPQMFHPLGPGKQKPSLCSILKHKYKNIALRNIWSSGFVFFFLRDKDPVANAEYRHIEENSKHIGVPRGLNFMSPIVERITTRRKI